MNIVSLRVANLSLTPSNLVPASTRRSPWRWSFFAGAILLTVGLVPAAELTWDPQKPDGITGPAREASQIRIELTGSGVCLDEVEVFAQGAPVNLALASTGGKVSASSCLSGYEAHRIEHLNDGCYGNGRSWIGVGDGPHWVLITLPRPAKVERVLVSRDRSGQYRDRLASQVTVSTSLDGKEFSRLGQAVMTAAAPAASPKAPPPPPVDGGSVADPPPAQGAPDKAPRQPTLFSLLLDMVQIDLDPAVEAKKVRLDLACDGVAMVDEVALYAPDGTEISGVSAGASTHAAAPKDKPSPFHISYVNDGRFGPASAWQAQNNGPAWIELNLPKPQRISRVVVSADRLNGAGHLRSVDLLVSSDGVAWKHAGKGSPQGLGDDTPSLARAFFAECRLRKRPPFTADFAETKALAQRLEEAGVTVTTERNKLQELETRVTQLDTAKVLPKELGELYIQTRQLKRDLLLRDPQLAGLSRILFVRRHPYTPSHNYSDFLDGNLRGGGGLSVLELPRQGDRLDVDKATVTALFDAGAGLARDPTIDWDAREIWFAYMPKVGRTPTGYTKDEIQRWHLYRLPATGGEAVQVTRGPYHDYYPCVLSNGDVSFVTTRCDMRFLCWVPTSVTLYRMHADGSGIRPLSFNNISEWFPTVRRDGRIMWTRSEYMDKGADYGHTIWTIRPDGTHPELVYGNNTSINIMNAMEVPGRENELCATIISHFGDFNGPLAYIDLTKGPYDPAAVTLITPEKRDTSNGGIFRDPWPISRDLILASHKDGAHWSLYLFDRAGNRELLYRDPAISCMTPVPLHPRPRPPVLPDINGSGPAVMSVIDVYDGLAPAVERGSVAWLRICRELPSMLEKNQAGDRQEKYDDFQKYYASPSDRIKVAWPAYVAKSVVGLVPVDPDGSAHFTVPTGQMFYFQALDRDFNEIQRMASIIQAQPGEQRTCLGCHDNRLRTATVGHHVTALTRPPSVPKPPPWGAGPFWYEKVVQPVLNKNCISCHDGAKGEKKLDLSATILKDTQAPASYMALIQGRYVNYLTCNWGTRHSKPPTRGVGTLKSRLFPILADPNHSGVKLSPEEMQAIKCWIDLNCPLWGDNQHRDERAAGKSYCTAVCPMATEPEKESIRKTP